MKAAEKGEIEIIREVFSYINRFKGTVFVIKIDYSIIDNPYFPVLLNDLSTLHGAGIRIIIIPGARERIDEILNQYGIHSKFRDSIRVTDENIIPFVKMAAFDVSHRIMSGLAGLKINALVGNWIRAKSLGVVDGVDYLFSGVVDKVLIDPLKKVLDDSFIPIVPVVGWNLVGKSYNLSSDELAIEVAEAVGADKLFFISDDKILKMSDFATPSGVISAPDGRISRMDESSAMEFLALNAGKSRHLEVCRRAVEGVHRGIKRVHILNGQGEGGLLSEIFSNLGVGTMIYKNEFDRIRPMKIRDIPEILRLMQPFVKAGNLIPRDKQSLQRDLDDFIVYETDGMIHGCAFLHLYPEEVGEIGAVAVDPEYEKLGIGRKLISFLISEARERKLKRLFLLTTKSGDWFEALGFENGKLSDLPGEKRNKYNTRRNSKIMVLNLK